MELKNLLRLFSDKNCKKIYVKELQKNNNSKQQIYIATGDTQVLNLFPTNSFEARTSGKRKTISFHAGLNFSWLDDEGKAYPAPKAKFIFYPDYPEVRFSGFISGSKKTPTEILNNKIAGRLLFFGISDNGEVFGYAVNPETEIAQEFKRKKNLEKIGVIYSLGITKDKIVNDTQSLLLNELRRIHLKGWITSKQLGRDNILSPCISDRCGGPTLEAELGIIQNGKSEPDYLGWEIKQFGVKKFNKIGSAKITLMTPEPDGGFYKTDGVAGFLKKYGYKSSSTEDRLDFTGLHRTGIQQNKTKLKLIIDGYNIETKKIIDPSKGIFLIDEKQNIAASWSFETMLNKWIKKHAKAGYIPSLKRMEPERQYQYSSKIQLGIGTDFNCFMQAFAEGKIYYDPAIRIKNISHKPDQKTRNQFRISSSLISELYHKVEEIDLLEL
jgi:hypothetical protein